MPLHTTILYIITASLIMIIGSLVFLKDRKLLANQSLFLFVITTTLWMISIYAGYYFINPNYPELSTFFIRLTFSFGLLMTLILCVFSYYYPRKIQNYSKTHISIFFFVTIFIVFLSFSTDLVYEREIIVNGNEIEDVHGPFHILYLLSFLFNSILAIWIAFRKKSILEGIERNKTIIYLFAVSSLILMGIVFHSILPIFGIYILQTQIVIFDLFFILITFYAISKHRFFNLSAFAVNLLRVIVFLIIVLLISLLSVYIFYYFFPEYNLIINITFFIVGILIYQKLNTLFPKFVPHNLRKFRIVIAELSYQLLFYDDYLELRKSLEESFIINLNIAKINLQVIREKPSNLDIPVYLKNVFIQSLEQLNTEILLKEEIPFLLLPDSEKSLLTTSMQDLEASVCLPLYSETKIIGIFTLGDKENKESYIEEEISVLIKFKKNLEICFMNILLKKNLKKENNLMKTTIEEKTAQIKKQYKKIKELLDQQSSFIAVTAHEFRTPLSIALFQLQDVLESDDKLKMDDIKTIEKSLNDLKNLTQNLFDVQQYDLDKILLKPEKTEIVTFICNVVKSCKKIADGKNLKCCLKSHLKKPLYCDIDKQQILQVFHNIVTNAIKFTPEKGHINVEFLQNSEGILIKVIDTGKGVADENKKRIFQKFQTEKLGYSTGIGLGLYICKKIVDLHKGKIWVEDNPKGGAIFNVLLKTL